ncbi:MAG: hypothetical protein KAR20_27085, partial [Candidatus Heimdallarchaeota archaeon]|nr:hypothetical protein [Candidatus Heimdallarchaeota archaeon]
VEGLDELDEEIQKMVLARSIDYWVADDLGYSSPQAWENMLSVLLSMNEIQEPIDITKAFSNDFYKE